MVGYVKQHFFVRYREFESWAHLNGLAERWLATEADRRVHGTVREVVAKRFAREAAQLKPLPASRFDKAYRERRFVSWDGYVAVRGNRYSAPAELCGQAVTVRIDLQGWLAVYDAAGEVVAEHRLQRATDGWGTVPAHHGGLWRQTVSVVRRDLARYEEAGQWN